MTNLKNITTKSVITVNGVSKSFGNHKVIDNLTFEVAEHTICGFLGINGAGKTTTFRLMNGLIAADSGEIKVGGKVVSPKHPSRKIKFLQDVPDIYSYLTAREYLTMICQLNNVDNIKLRVDESLDLMGLKESSNRRVGGYSRGMKQRLGLASVVITEPDILLLDEPVSALDPVGRKAIFDLLLRIKDRMTILFSTHIIEDVAHVADQVVMIDHGKKLLDGSVEELEQSFGQRTLSVEFENRDEIVTFSAGFPSAIKIKENVIQLKPEDAQNMTDLQFEVFSFLSKNKISVKTVKLDSPSLEDVFIKEVGNK